MLRAVRNWLTTLKTTRDIESSILTSSHSLVLRMRQSFASHRQLNRRDCEIQQTFNKTKLIAP